MNRTGVRSQPVLGAFVQGLTAAVAVAALSSTAGGTVDGAVPIAIGMGIVAAIFGVAGEWLHRLAGWCYSAIGVAAFVPTAVDFIRSNGCLQGPPPAIRFAAVALLVVIALTAAAASLVSFGHAPAAATGLALFGGLEILITAGVFIAGPAGGGDWTAIAALIPAAGVLGWFVVRAGDAVLAVTGAALGMQSLYSAALDPGCGVANFSGVALIVVFCGAHFATRAVCAPFAGRR